MMFFVNSLPLLIIPCSLDVLISFIYHGRWYISGVCNTTPGCGILIKRLVLSSVCFSSIFYLHLFLLLFLWRFPLNSFQQKYIKIFCGTCFGCFFYLVSFLFKEVTFGSKGKPGNTFLDGLIKLMKGANY